MAVLGLVLPLLPELAFSKWCEHFIQAQKEKGICVRPLK